MAYQYDTQSEVRSMFIGVLLERERSCMGCSATHYRGLNPISRSEILNGSRPTRVRRLAKAISLKLNRDKIMTGS